MENRTINSLGGNQYEVIIDGDKKRIDMDGWTVIADEDMEKLEMAGVDNEGFISPMSADGDLHWQAAAEYCVNYSGFDVDQYIKENK